MTTILSAILYFLTQHRIWSLPLIFLFFTLLGGILSTVTKNPKWLGLFVVGIISAMANVFLSHFVNALFLNAVGVKGSAVIVHSEQTNSTLNDAYIWDYDAVLKTVDGKDVPFSFDTMSASIYPIRNEILIPAQGQLFTVKYVPGFPRNVVILSDQSTYGIERQITLDLQPVEKAEAQLAFSPDNPSFNEEYRRALQKFIAAHRTDADPGIIEEYQQKLDALPPPRN
jgi:hypothetical protein